MFLIQIKYKKFKKKKKKIVIEPSPIDYRGSKPYTWILKKKKEKIKKIQTPIQVTEQITSKSEIMKGFIKEKEITKLLKA